MSTTTPALDEPPIPPLNLLLITAAMMSVSILPALDMTVANVALPHMQGAISASQEQIAWVLTSYVIATAIAMPFSGWLAERFGRSQVLVWSVAGFTLSSVFCGLSTSLGQIVISRLLQGAFGASMIPLSQAVIIQYYPPHRVRRGLAIWSSGTMIAPIIGPTLGGLLTDTVGWQWIFYLNVPIGLVSIMSILAILPRDKPQTDRQLDFFGFASLSLAVGALQALLDRGQQLDWFNSVEIHVEASIALIAATYFIVHTLTTRERSFFRQAPHIRPQLRYLHGGHGYRWRHTVNDTSTVSAHAAGTVSLLSLRCRHGHGAIGHRFGDCNQPVCALGQ